MTDDAGPPATLPLPAKARKVRLAWVREGLSPSPSFRGFEDRDSLEQAVADAIEGYEGRRKSGLLPWLRAGTGAGSAVLNIQGILLLRAALDAKSER